MGGGEERGETLTLLNAFGFKLTFVSSVLPRVCFVFRISLVSFKL